MIDLAMNFSLRLMSVFTGPHISILLDGLIFASKIKNKIIFFPLVYDKVEAKEDQEATGLSCRVSECLLDASCVLTIVRDLEFDVTPFFWKPTFQHEETQFTFEGHSIYIIEIQIRERLGD